MHLVPRRRFVRCSGFSFWASIILFRREGANFISKCIYLHHLDAFQFHLIATGAKGHPIRSRPRSRPGPGMYFRRVDRFLTRFMVNLGYSSRSWSWWTQGKDRRTWSGRTDWSPRRSCQARIRRWPDASLQKDEKIRFY